MAELMTPQHPKWDSFSELLEGPEGCNFKEGPAPEKKITWRCDGGCGEPTSNRFRYARAILVKMADIDVEGSLKYFLANGGHCDCEILFNVAARGFSEEAERS